MFDADQDRATPSHRPRSDAEPEPNQRCEVIDAASDTCRRATSPARLHFSLSRSKQLFDRRSEFRPRHCAEATFAHRSASIDEDRCRNSNRAIARRERRVGIEHDRVSHADARRDASASDRLSLRSTPQECHSRSRVFMDSLEAAHLLAARRTPRRPEVHGPTVCRSTPTTRCAVVRFAGSETRIAVRRPQRLPKLTIPPVSRPGGIIARRYALATCGGVRRSFRCCARGLRPWCRALRSGR